MICRVFFKAGQRQTELQSLYTNRGSWIYKCICTRKHASWQHTWFQSWSAGQASRVTAFLGVFVMDVLPFSPQALLVVCWITSCLWTLSLVKQSGRQHEQILSCLNLPGVDHKFEEHLGFMLVRPYWQWGTRWLFSGYWCSVCGIDMQHVSGDHDL